MSAETRGGGDPVPSDGRRRTTGSHGHMGDEQQRRHPRVLDLATGVAGGYASLLLTEVGAEVIRAEPPDGDPLRRWRHGDDEATGDGPLFQNLRQGQTSWVVDADALDAATLVGLGADIVLATPVGGARDVLREAV